MTLEELKNKKVTVTILNPTFSLYEDLGETILNDFIEEQKDEGYSDEELIRNIIDTHYCTTDDLIGTLEDFEVKIHD